MRGLRQDLVTAVHEIADFDHAAAGIFKAVFDMQRTGHNTDDHAKGDKSPILAQGIEKNVVFCFAGHKDKRLSGLCIVFILAFCYQKQTKTTIMLISPVFGVLALKGCFLKDKQQGL